MKFQKCGHLYKFNSDNIIFNKIQTIKIEEIKKNILDYIIFSTISIFESEPNSVYLRGSCINKKIEDTMITDIDIVFVFDNNCFNEKIYNLKEKIAFFKFPYMNNKMFMTDTQKKIETDIFKKYNKNLQVDIEISCEQFFQQDYQKRFFSKQIYGTGKNLSLKKLNKENLSQSLNNDELKKRKRYCLSKVIELKKLFYLNMNFFDNVEMRFLKSTIKAFYRLYSFKLHLQENCFSRDIYYCHNILIKYYPQFLIYIEKILDLFLNYTNYSHQDIRLILTELEYVINEIDYINRKL